MTHHRTIRAALSGLLTAVVLLTTSAAAAVAADDEQPGARAADDRRRDEGARRGHGWRRDSDDRPRHGQRVGRLARSLFAPIPADQGPLEPGEKDALLAFAEERMPRIHALLSRLKQRQPERFEARFEQLAPHLRHLRRVYEQNPAIGQIIQQHAENRFRMRQRARVFDRRDPDSALYSHAHNALRELVAENVQLELKALHALHDTLMREMDDRVAQQFEEITAPEADLSAYPLRVRRAIREFVETEDPAARNRRREQIEQGIRRIFEQELKALSERIEEMHARADEEVDARLERYLEQAQRGAGDHGRRDGRGRPRDGRGRGRR